MVAHTLLPPSHAAEPSNAVLEQAADWYALLCSHQATDDDKSRWHEWLQAAAEHRTAWQYVEEISGRFASLYESVDPRMAAATLARANARLRRRRRALAGIVASAGAGMLGWLAWRNALLPGAVLAWAADYRTGVGAQRDIVLEDGSRIWLNTASAINVAYDTSQRLVTLVDGEIFIATAADAARPFLVDTDQGRLRALGTRFNVLQGQDQTRMAVYEGAVEIRIRSSNTVAVIEAGRQAVFTRDGITQTAAADPAREAWTSGLLVARDLALRDVVAELRRYRNGHIGLADGIAGLKVYGNFPVRDTDHALAMLATALPIQVRRTLPWWISIEPRS
ncbi:MULTISPECIES: FecR domain-containing protein [unclassified Achromobacter]|uniref:FecR domain-containing protein n=1 Tax=unclassified Achromobacter TaxID=2626865 RepID=UPI000B51D1B6|nr:MULTISPECIES: FecR family protein [unclassified Achromobacter]OWT75412.1 iron dicitrate transport regulator FecR [Achromobacter sp. HZ28]OWT76072.1 iron dicitrate transport regulator FecR [Achromobacter sp. HZ34]